MNSRQVLKITATLFALVALLVSWRMLAPGQLGGTAAYAITHGNSMEPTYREGDLVVLRKHSSYQKGDIVAYSSPTIGDMVLHRIEGRDDRGFITKGDNNGWLDSDRPNTADVIGKAWLHIPGAGKWLARTKTPGVAATLLGLVTLSFLLGNEKKKSRRAKNRKGADLPRMGFGSFTQQQKVWLASAAGLLLVFLVLTAVGFKQPLVSAVTADAAFEHVGDFSYSAQVPKSAVYPSGQVDPDRPIFRSLVDELQVRFDYRLNSKADHAVGGEAMMFVRVSGATGWKKALPVSRVQEFKGNKVSLEGSLDLNKIERLSQQVQAMTGVPEATQKLELIPRISVTGEVGGADIAERFAPSLELEMDSHQVKIVPTAQALPGQPPADLHQTEPSEVSISETRANDLRLLGVSFEIRSVRTLGLLGLLLALATACFLWLRFSNPAHADEASLIAAQYGDWLIPVESMDRSGTKMVQIKSIESLVRLAELYERMILHDEGPKGHSYFVEEDGVVYCYRTAPEKSSPPGQPSKTPKFTGRQSREERRKAQVEKLRKELDEIEQEVLKAGPSEE